MDANLWGGRCSSFHKRLKGENRLISADGVNSFLQNCTGSRPVEQLTAGIGSLYEGIGGIDRLSSGSTAHRSPMKGEHEYELCSDTAGCPSARRGPSATLLNARYRILETITRGNVCLILRCEDTFFKGLCTCSGSFQHRCRESQVAIKVMHRDYTLHGWQESERMRHLQDRNPNGSVPIMTMKDRFFQPKARLLCLVFELLGDSLTNLLQKPMRLPSSNMSYLENDSSSPASRGLPLSDVRKVAAQLITALIFLHDNDVIHSDLKPENILVTEKNDDCRKVKLADFGNAMSQKEAVCYFDDFNVQSLPYRAPEVLLGVPFTTAIDMWSVGCVICELYTGEVWFHCSDRSSLYHSMLDVLGPMPQAMLSAGKYSPISSGKSTGDEFSFAERHAAVSSRLVTEDASFVDFVIGLLNYVPEQRMTAVEALAHSFFGSLYPWSTVFGAVVRHPPRYMCSVAKTMTEFEPIERTCPGANNGKRRRDTTSSVSASGRRHVARKGIRASLNTRNSSVSSPKQTKPPRKEPSKDESCRNSTTAKHMSTASAAVCKKIATSPPCAQSTNHDFTREEDVTMGRKRRRTSNGTEKPPLTVAIGPSNSLSLVPPRTSASSPFRIKTEAVVGVKTEKSLSKSGELPRRRVENQRLGVGDVSPSPSTQRRDGQASARRDLRNESLVDDTDDDDDEILLL